MVESGKVIGRFYLDMHPRENKYTHAAMFPIRVGVKDRQVPVAALLTNFPTGLMEHGQVETFLHEFGHLIHWIFAGQQPFAAQNFGEIENDVALRALRAMFVAIPPGWTQWTPTGLRAITISWRSASVKPRTANFAAL